MRKPCIVKQLLTMQGFSIFWPPVLNFRPGGLRTVTDFIGFAGRRTQTVPAPGPPFLLHAARWFAYGNQIYWLCGQAYANRAGTRAACFLCAARSRHQYAWRMASMMFSAPTMEIPARVNLLFFFGRIIFS